MTAVKMLFVGGPAHGKLLDVDLSHSDRILVSSNETPSFDKVTVDPAKSVAHTHKPYEVYLPRKLASSSQIRIATDWRSLLPGGVKPKSYVVMVHDSLGALIYPDIVDAILESGLLEAG